jgi:hypothetical protein
MELEIGAPVAFHLNDDVLIVGWIKGYHRDSETVIIKEAHAFHKLWGGSNNARGTEHTVVATRIEDCPGAYRHIVEEVRGG